MTNEELRAVSVRIDEISIELNVIMDEIQDHNTVLEVLWERYWKLFNELTNIGRTNGND